MKRLEELRGDLIEIRAYRALQNESFDFGSGLIENNNNGSEDDYYKMQEEKIIKEIEKEKKKIRNNKHKAKKTRRKNKHYLNKKAKERLKRLHKQGVYTVYKAVNKDTGKEYPYKFYLTGRRKMAKRQTNKKVRKRNDFSLKGAGYRKVHDYWWEVF